jgi:glutamyl endopeptidase
LRRTLATLLFLALAMVAVSSTVAAQEDPSTTTSTGPPTSTTIAPPTTTPTTAAPTTAPTTTPPTTAPPATTPPTAAPAPEIAALADPEGIITSTGREISSAEAAAGGDWRRWGSRPGTGKTANKRIAATNAPPAEGAGDDVGISSVIGPDQRVVINPTTSFPARTIAYVTLTLGGTGFRCSGFMISANTVATAGHCVHAGSGGAAGFAKNVRVTPGRNFLKAPYGTCNARELFTSNGWANGAGENYDYGAIKLSCTVGNATGWLGYYTQTNPSLVNTLMNVAGYPADKKIGTQWRATGAIKVMGVYQLFYYMDTFGGQSGGPVYHYKKGCGYCAAAIHGYGVHGTGAHGRYNHGERIGLGVSNLLTFARNKP